MRKLLTILAVFLTIGVSAQTYVNGSFSCYNSPGTFGEKVMPMLEVGQTWDVLSVGVAGGTTAFTNGNAMVVLRPSIQIFSKGRVSLSTTLGGGYVFNSPSHLVTEITTSGNVAINKNWTLSAFGGRYRFSGKNTASTATFVGTGLTYVFK